MEKVGAVETTSTDPTSSMIRRVLKSSEEFCVDIGHMETEYQPNLLPMKASALQVFSGNINHEHIRNMETKDLTSKII